MIGDTVKNCFFFSNFSFLSTILFLLEVVLDAILNLNFIKTVIQIVLRMSVDFMKIYQTMNPDHVDFPKQRHQANARERYRTQRYSYH